DCRLGNLPFGNDRLGTASARFTPSPVSPWRGSVERMKERYDEPDGKRSPGDRPWVGRGVGKSVSPRALGVVRPGPDGEPSGGRTGSVGLRTGPAALGNVVAGPAGTTAPAGPERFGHRGFSLPPDR